jgi:formyl-CoA transferase
VTTDPQTLANGIIVPIEGDSGHLTRTVGSPIRIHGIPKAAARRAPELGEHNDEILKNSALPTTKLMDSAPADRFHSLSSS